MAILRLDISEIFDSTESRVTSL